MQILFNKTITQCRKIGARGGRARVRNLRNRTMHAVPKAARMPVPVLETAAEASALLDRQFPWLIDAEKSQRLLRGGVHEARAVL